MKNRRAPRLIAGLSVVLLLSACGKRGNPLPPLRPIPARIADLTAHRVGDRIELGFTIPAANADGSTPAAVDRVEVYEFSAAPGATAPTAAQITADPKNLRGTILVRREEAAKPSAPASPAPPAAPQSPAPGDHAGFREELNPARISAGGNLYYVAVGVAGGGRGRRGVVSAVIATPLGELPAPPAGLSIDYDATQIVLSWQAVAGQAFRVLDVPSAGADATAAPALTPTPLSAATFSTPVTFGRERCFSLRAVRVSGAVTIEGVPSPVRCVTPVDRFPPPAPAGLQAVQDGAAVALLWSPVEASDLAGYVVLRSDGGETFRPLMREPIAETTFRDTTVRPGGAYLYAAVAIDKTGNPSEQSNRQAVTVR